MSKTESKSTLELTKKYKNYNPGEQTKFVDAIAKADAGAVKELLEKGINPAMRDVLSRERLIEAARSNNVPVVGMLLTHQIVKNAINKTDAMEQGDSALHHAAKNRNIQMIELLIKNGADPNLKNSQGFLPENTATSSFALETLKNAKILGRQRTSSGADKSDNSSSGGR